jgi:hypothetical protein
MYWERLQWYWHTKSEVLGGGGGGACTIASFPTKYLTWTGLASNLGLHGNWMVIDRLSDDMSLKPRLHDTTPKSSSYPSAHTPRLYSTYCCHLRRYCRPSASATDNVALVLYIAICIQICYQHNRSNVRYAIPNVMHSTWRQEATLIVTHTVCPHVSDDPRNRPQFL